MTIQDHPGLDAAGFLLLAEGHLRKAREVNAQDKQTELVEEAEKYMDYANSWLQYAIQTLTQEKEDPCNKP